MRPKLVILESPFAGDVEANLAYARRAAHRCALLGEATQASHLYYTQFLDDGKPEERKLGMALGLAWTSVADYSVFFTDRGWSSGMVAALKKIFSRANHWFPLGAPPPFRLRALDSMVLLPAATMNIVYGNWQAHIDMEHGILR